MSSAKCFSSGERNGEVENGLYDSPLTRSQRHVPNTFVFKQLASLRKLEELAMKFEQAQISRKLAASVSHRKLSQVGGQTRYKRAQAKNLR